MKYIYVLCLSILIHSMVFAQDEASFSIQAPSRVYLGEDFEVSFVLNASGGKDFKAPSFRGFNLRWGPSQSTSSSFQFINGHASQSVTHNFSYRLSANEEGSFYIDPAYISLNGNILNTERFNITVLPARSTPNSPAHSSQQHSQRQQARQTSSQEEEHSVSSDDIFLRAIVSNANPYVGQEISLTYRIYTSVSVRQYNVTKLPSNKGFWSVEAQTSQNEQRQTINGKSYVYVDVYKATLYPQESGTLSIDPMEMEAMVAVAAKRRSTGSIFDIFDDPFFDRVSYQKIDLASKPVKVEVKPLPSPRPSSFMGAVGEYKASFSYDKTKEVRVGEALSFNFKVSGSGNLSHIQAPNIKFPPDFEVFDPKSKIEKSSASFDYIVVPRSSGVYRIPKFEYSFFSPSKGKYQTVEIDEIVLEVKDNGNIAYIDKGAGSKSAYIEDISPIKTHSPHFAKKDKKVFFLSGVWWLLQALVLLAFVVLAFAYKKYLAKQSDIVGILNRKASKEAKRCLAKAKNFMSSGKKDEFYIEISQALWGFLSHKFNISTSVLSLESAKKALLEKNINQESVEAFIKTLNNCEFQRFAPTQNQAKEMETLYLEALEIISRIVKELK